MRIWILHRHPGRRETRDLLCENVAQTVAADAKIDGELWHLIGAIRS